MQHHGPIHTPPTRLEWIDAARGLAALSVTLYHFQIGNALAHLTHWPALVWFSWPGNRLAVPLFFVISGFSIHYAEHRKISGWTQEPSRLKSYCLRRCWRIYPPYLAALLLAGGVGWVLGRRPSVPDLVAHLSMVHQFFPAYFNSINVVFWSIGVEMWLYLLYPFALSLLEKRGLRTTGMLVFLVSAVSIALTAILSAAVNVVGMWFVLNLFFGWCMGAAIAEGFLKNNLFFRSWLWWIAGAVLLALHLGLCYAGWFETRLWPVFVPAVIVLSAWSLSAVVLLERPRLLASAGPERHWTFGILRWLGAISYSLYLVHQPLIDVRDLVVQHLPGHLLNRVVFFLWYSVPFVVAWLCWLWIEKPSMRMSKRLRAATA